MTINAITIKYYIHQAKKKQDAGKEAIEMSKQESASMGNTSISEKETDSLESNLILTIGRIHMYKYTPHSFWMQHAFSKNGVEIPSEKIENAMVRLFNKYSSV